MKQITFLFLLLTSLSPLFGQNDNGQQTKKKVAVYIASSANESVGKVIGNKLVAAITKQGQYIAVERTTEFLAQLQKEQNYQRGGNVDDNQLSKLGKQFGVDYVCVADITEVMSSYFISARLIDVITGEVISTGEDYSGDTKVIQNLIKSTDVVTANLLGISNTKQTSQTKRPFGLPSIGFPKHEGNNSETTNQEKENPEEKITKKNEKKKIAEERARDEAEKNRQIAQTATNSYTMANSVSDMILQAITKQESKNTSKYKTDEERFDQLKKREDITKYINTITSDVGGYPSEDDDYITFFCKKDPGNDEMVLLFFLDERCIGIGSRNKGLLTKIPNTQKAGIHTISIWNHNKELLSTPVSLAHKFYYSFEWNKNDISTSKEAKDTDSDNSSVNSFNLSNSISNLIKNAIEKQNKKYNTFQTDEDRFNNLKDNEDLTKYIISMTNNVGNIPQNDNGNIVLYMEPTKGNELALLLFLDGQCIGAGTKNKGVIVQIPKQQYTGMHALSLWSNDKELLNIPVNFDFKFNYVFEWNKNTVILNN